MQRFCYRAEFSFPLGRRLGVRYRQVCRDEGIWESAVRRNQAAELPKQGIPEACQQFQARRKLAFREYCPIKWSQEY